MLRSSIVLILASLAAAAQGVETTQQHTRTKDVIYGRKYGMALTLDVFTPKRGANGCGVIFVSSLGWGSTHELADNMPVGELLEHGYTVFAVAHGSKPKFTIPEAIEDMHRAVRFIRSHAKDYSIKGDCIGATGVSSGGHLSLLLGTSGREGDPAAKDPLERVSSRVQAVACFFPPTDFLNYGVVGEDAIGRGILEYYRPAFDFHKLNASTKTFERIIDEKRIREIGRRISPITHVSEDDAPTLIIHGDADMMVPIQQSETFLKKLEDAGVHASLVVKPGASHIFKGWKDDMPTIADWFDKHLKGPAGTD
ncbi:MAG: alpha/beta hydrolase [Phycisphaerales bacterium]|nr:MAG: alpha/beta hydrolase [Phycisphaerales bacterium]